MTTDKKPKKPEPKASVTIKEFLGVPKKAPLLVDVEVPPALAAVIPREPKERKDVAISPPPPIAADHSIAIEAVEPEMPPMTRVERDELLLSLGAICLCCGNPKSGGVACVVCGN